MGYGLSQEIDFHDRDFYRESVDNKMLAIANIPGFVDVEEQWSNWNPSPEYDAMQRKFFVTLFDLDDE